MGIGIESTAAVTSELVKQNKGDGDSDHSHDFDNCKHSDGENLSSPEASPTRKVNESSTKVVHVRP